MIKTVIFSVGVKHPLYNKPVRAEIISENCGFDRRQTYARTIKPVHYWKDPKGILIFDENHRHIGYKSRPAYDEIWEGYCSITNE